MIGQLVFVHCVFILLQFIATVRCEQHKLLPTQSLRITVVHYRQKHASKQLMTSMQDMRMLKICTVEKISLTFGPVSVKGTRIPNRKRCLLFVILQCSLKFGFVCVICGMSVDKV